MSEENEEKELFSFVHGDLSLKELAVFLENMKCLVSGSTGPMHLAGIMGTPTVGVFSNKPAHSKLKWHPINNRYRIIEPPGLYDASNEETLMKNIDLAKVEKAVVELSESDGGID